MYLNQPPNKIVDVAYVRLCKYTEKRQFLSKQMARAKLICSAVQKMPPLPTLQHNRLKLKLKSNPLKVIAKLTNLIRFLINWLILLILRLSMCDSTYELIFNFP